METRVKTNFAVLSPISGLIFIYLLCNSPNIMDLTDLRVFTISVTSLKYENKIFYKTLKFVYYSFTENKIPEYSRMYFPFDSLN